jgi:hypothetical protein
MAEAVTSVLPHRRLWISSLSVAGRGSYQQYSVCFREAELLGLEVAVAASLVGAK